ncbi:MAG: sigma-54 dependent transcriptional regulator [Deltaproteobacteria bacterium]|nr:sigma-54 dependent transcriptional regulator [Deltaproteobacteria bacterium]
MVEKIRILVIDDDESTRDYLRALITKNGWRVFTAESGEQALMEMEKVNPTLVTLDLVLPGIDGIETLRLIKEKDQDVPVIMLSGHGQAKTIVQAMKLGATDFLRKPFESDELKIAINKALEKKKLVSEVEFLRVKVQEQSNSTFLFGTSTRMKEVEEIVEQVADTDITVLIRGESGTGKELVARMLAAKSDRSSKPFVKVNCAALPSELLESELFGFEKGAFTGAQKRKLGKFEYADGGTIFLDEISEMHPNLQAKLLQVLQDGEFSRLGGEADVNVDTRVLAATNRNLEEAVKEGSFREDLFYRLNVVNIPIPALRERRADIPLFIDYFLTKYNEQYHKDVPFLSTGTMDTFMKYAWPGNVRELENMIKRIVVLGSEKAVLQEFQVREDHPATQKQFEHEGIDSITESDPGRYGLKEIGKRASQLAEKRVIARVLQQTRWNRKETAEILQISYKALLYKMKESGLSEMS